MKAGSIVVAIVIIIAIVALAYIVTSGKFGSSSSSISISTGSSYTTITNSNTTTANPTCTTTIYQISGGNKSLAVEQVISSLGTGWTSAAQYSSNNTNLTYPNGSKVMVKALGSESFSNGGELLSTEWVAFYNPIDANNYVNSALKSMFPNASNVTTGLQGDSTYMFYSGDAINKGQAAAVIYAHDGPYAILIFNQGTALQLSQAKQLLAYQLSDLNIT
ncbi:MAG: hypothetical protein ABR981_00230 [Candidatus Micrarchaeaceae archaeon]